MKDHYHLCSRHFTNADAGNKPDLSLGKRFASPRKPWTSRAKRARLREAARSLTPQMFTCQLSRPSSPVNPSVPSTPESQETETVTPLVAAVGEQLCPDYVVHEVSTDDDISESSCSTLTMPESSSTIQDEHTQFLVSTTLLARIEALESENSVVSQATVAASLLVTLLHVISL